jgi:hypothetical protein
MMSALGKESEVDGEAERMAVRRRQGGWSCSPSVGACRRISPEYGLPVGVEVF